MGRRKPGNDDFYLSPVVEPDTDPYIGTLTHDEVGFVRSAEKHYDALSELTHDVCSAMNKLVPQDQNNPQSIFNKNSRKTHSEYWNLRVELNYLQDFISAAAIKHSTDSYGKPAKGYDYITNSGTQTGRTSLDKNSMIGLLKSFQKRFGNTDEGLSPELAAKVNDVTNAAIRSFSGRLSAETMEIYDQLVPANTKNDENTKWRAYEAKREEVRGRIRREQDSGLFDLVPSGGR